MKVRRLCACEIAQLDADLEAFRWNRERLYAHLGAEALARADMAKLRMLAEAAKEAEVGPDRRPESATTVVDHAG